MYGSSKRRTVRLRRTRSTVGDSIRAYEEEIRPVTLIILTALATAWLGYFALWFRDKRASRSPRGDDVNGFTLSFDALASGTVSIRSLEEGSRSRGDLWELPRTPEQAHRRRRHVATMLATLALASLLAVPVFGPTALAVHVMVDVVLLLFAFGSIHRQQPPAINLADVRVLYPDRPASSDAVATSLGRVANG